MTVYTQIKRLNKIKFFQKLQLTTLFIIINIKIDRFLIIYHNQNATSLNLNACSFEANENNLEITLN